MLRSHIDSNCVEFMELLFEKRVDLSIYYIGTCIMNIHHQFLFLLKPTMKSWAIEKPFFIIILMLSMLPQAHSVDEDPNLIDFRKTLQIVMLNHPSIFSKENGIKVAETQIDIAEWKYWPTPSITHKRTAALGSDPVSNPNESVISLEQPLWQGGALDAELAAAKAYKKESTAALQKARMDVTLQTIKAFGEAFSAKKNLEAKQKNVELLQGLYDQIKRRAESGLSPLSDVRLAEGRIKTAESGLLSTQTNFRNAQEELYALMGRTFPIDYDSFEDHNFEWNNIEQDIDKAVANSPETAEIREQVAKLRWHAKQTQASVWPKVSLVVSQTHNGAANDGESIAYINVASDWQAGLSVAARGESAELQVLAKVNEIDFLLRQVEKNVRSDYLLHSSTKENIATLEDALGASSSIFDSWNRQFRAGRKSWQQVMDSAKEREGVETMIASSIAAVSTTSWRLAARVNGVDWVLNEQ